MINVEKTLKDNNVECEYDYLTQTLSRNSIENYINILIDNKKPFALFFMDIDNFKYVNDTKGHQVGDIVLKKVAFSLSSVVNGYGAIGRYGGDEFLVIFEGDLDYDSVWKYGKDLVTSIRELKLPFFSDNDIMKNLSTTAGCSRFPVDAKDYESLIKLADKALYRGKSKGRNCFIIYNPELHKNLLTTNELNKYNLEELINITFDKLTNVSHSLNVNLKNLLIFLAIYMNLDYLCLDDEKIEVCSDQNKLKAHIDFDKYEEITKSGQNVCVIASRINLIESNPELFSILKEQNIKSIMLVKCNYNDENYGYLRLESKRERIWSSEDKYLLLFIAKIYSSIKHGKK